VVVDLTRGLRDRGIESRLACLLDAGEWAGEAAVEGVWVGDLERNGAWRTLRGLCRYVRAHRIDLIHSHNSHPHKYAVPVSLLTRRPLVHTKHGRNWPDNPKWVWFSRQLSRFTKVVVPVSAEIEKIVTQVEKVPPVKVRTILNGVPRPRHGVTKSSSHQRELFGLPKAAFIVGSVGRFSPEKQYPRLVRTFAAMRRGLPDCMLVLVGDGPERAKIEAAAEESGVADNALLTGMRSDVADWLACMDVFCLSSDQEGTSVTLLEAGAAGLPAVVTDVGGNAEIVEDGRTGIVVPFGDDAAMAEAFRRLASDRGLRESMGQRARERIAERYSIDSMVEQYVEVYQWAVGGGGNPAD